MNLLYLPSLCLKVSHNAHKFRMLSSANHASANSVMFVKEFTKMRGAPFSGTEVDLVTVADVELDSSAACAFTGLLRAADGSAVKPSTGGDARASRIKNPLSSYFFAAEPPLVSFGIWTGNPWPS